ncbi:TRAP transporter small permease [Tateyamaria sp. ANG-S1]|uniref:TRAP transporter small permease n=1 Tax=Tateyamaria sp. ANG-S1 TaxID=1577905 RepID=UPI0005807F85|nr:TRAP transporter small permease [Tateyamaria sp. ANG-S1]KIC48043.1 transporter [Tateyamaria sp. ANG-S1]
MQHFLTFERWSTGLALTLAIAFLIIAASLAMWQVTTRFVIGVPSTWSEVITRSAMIWSVFLGVAATYRHGSMIAMEIVQRALPGRLGLWLYLGANGLSVTFFAILFWQGWGMTERVARQTLAALEVSIAWVYAALPVGAVFAIIAILGCSLRAWSAGSSTAAVEPIPDYEVSK